MSKMTRLYATDDDFREVANLLFGEGSDQLVSKLTADEKKFQRRQAQVGLASNIVGLAAGAAGTKEAYSHFKRVKAVKTGGELIQAPLKISGKTKLLAAGALGLQGTNMVGDAVANRVLARSAKDKPKKAKIKKSSPDKADLHISGGKLKRMAAKKIVESPPIQNVKVEVGGKSKKAFGKSVVWEGEISKIDTDKRQVFGWASIVELNGQPIVDLQGDYIDIDEIEKSAYEYVVKSRKGGNMHERNGEGPRHVSDLIESFLVTPEKIEKMGLPAETPLGWWVGYQVNDEDTWNLVKSGKRTGFSIHGRGRREDAII